MTHAGGPEASAPRLPALARADLDPGAASLFDDIATSRGGMPTSFRVFLNSPNAARAISEFGKYVRWGSADRLGDRVIEIVCLRVAAVLEDPFMWAHHAVLAREAGLSAREIELLREPRSVTGFDDADRELVAFIDAELRYAMTDDIFEAVSGRLGAAATFDLALATAYYAMHHILFSTLRLDSQSDTRIPLDQELAHTEGATR